MKLPPTRNHRQLAAWINARRLVDSAGREVCARAFVASVAGGSRTSPRTPMTASPARGLVLEIWLNGASIFDPSSRLYRHESSETYRKHSEAREWVEKNLRRRSAR